MTFLLKRSFVLITLIALIAAPSFAGAQKVTLVLLRHGQSIWNLEDRFTGWSDVELTEKGVQGALTAGEEMRKAGLNFDVVHVSLLRRALETAWLAAKGMEMTWLPVEKYWRLNERCYGDLEGKTRKEVAEAVGAEQVNIWRRSFDVPPPALNFDDPRSPVKDPRYAKLDKKFIPQAESLKDTIARVGPYWSDVLLPALYSGKNVLVVGHSTCLRALSSWIEPALSPEELQKLEIPNTTPVVYEIELSGDGLKILSRKVIKQDKK
ncbi:MAG: 2,3-bisphosphoglycerate-dependent phosphoglycerate mutase [Synergistaceae bacterium]|nr:2,3-bisphosphoglycerate-dependent phosphoglycerate mutase [Synergistaceae bacterium]